MAPLKVDVQLSDSVLGAAGRAVALEALGVDGVDRSAGSVPADDAGAPVIRRRPASPRHRSLNH